MIKIVSRLLNTSAADKQFLKKEKDHLVVGKDDRKIGIMSDGNIIPLLTASLSLMNAQNGSLTIPTDTGNVIVQWGQATLQANTSGSFDFPKPFPNTCFQIIGSHKNDDTLTSLSITSTVRTGYTVKITGGINGENVSWIAIGN